MPGFNTRTYGIQCQVWSWQEAREIAAYLKARNVIGVTTHIVDYDAVTKKTTETEIDLSKPG